MSPAVLAKILALGFQNTFVYRWNFLSRLLMAFVPLLGLVYFWSAVFGARGGEEINGYSYGGMIFYFLLGGLVQSLTMPMDDEWQIASDIRDGQLSHYLLKPVDYLQYRAMLFVSNRAVYSLVAFLPTLAVFLWFRGYVVLPSDPSTWFLAALSVALTAALQFLVAYTIALMSFWILEVSTIVFIYFAFEYILAGHLFPLDIMPPWIYEIIRWTPFPYQLYFPVAVFKERITGAEVWQGLAIQAAWVVLMWLASRALWNRGLKKYAAVGG